MGLRDASFLTGGLKCARVRRDPAQWVMAFCTLKFLGDQEDASGVNTILRLNNILFKL